jgi:hypothetical protein
VLFAAAGGDHLRRDQQLGRQQDAGGVDQALRALRLSTYRRTALVLCGEGDLVLIDPA